jgi:hypothetical protein
MASPYSKLPWRVEPNGESPEVDGYNVVDDNDFYLALVEKKADADFMVELANATMPGAQYKCPGCGSVGFKRSPIDNACSFCDGTENGEPPVFDHKTGRWQRQ